MRALLLLLLSISLAACATRPDVKLLPTVEPKGRIVLLPKTAFRVAANYQLRVSQNGVDVASVTSTPQAGAAVRDLAAGLYRVKIDGPDLRTIRMDVKVRDGKVTLITLPVEEAPRRVQPLHEMQSLLTLILTSPIRIAYYALAILFQADMAAGGPLLRAILEALVRGSRHRH